MRKFSCLWSQFVSFWSACLQESEEQQHGTVGHFNGFDVNVCPGDSKLQKYQILCSISASFHCLGNVRQEGGNDPFGWGSARDETGRGSPHAHWPAWQCCRDAWQVNLQTDGVGAMAWLGCWPAQDGHGTEQSGSEHLYLEQHLILLARGCRGLSCPRHRQDSVVWKTSHWALWALWAEWKYFNTTYFLPPLQNTSVQ